jgi:hypothetical protein
MHTKSWLTVIVVLVATGSMLAQLPEIEPNGTKAEALANGAFVLDAGGVNNAVTGITTGTSVAAVNTALTSADTFLIQTALLPLGIYEHRLTLTTTGTAGHTGTLRGLTQTAGAANPGTDATIQTSSTATTPPRSNVWYGFGKGEQIYYRVTGTTSTTVDYVSTLTTTPVTPACFGTHLAPGVINISFRNQGHTTDTDCWVYDSNFDAIATFGNDDSIAGCNGLTGTSVQSCFTRTYAPGTYYLAVSNFQLASNQTAPIDDNFRTGTLLDFPDAVANSSTSANLNLTFSFTDGNGVHQVTLNKGPAYTVRFVKFVVDATPAPPAYETNSPEASLSIDFLSGAPIKVRKCVNQWARVVIGSTLTGQPWDLCVSSFPCVTPPGPCGPGAGIATANGQVVNLDLGNPIECIGGLQFTNSFPGDFIIPVQGTTPFSASGQMVVLDASHPDGFQLSTCVELSFDPAPGAFAPLPGPTGDDTFVTFGGACWPFYFRGFTQCSVNSNSRISFGPGDTDWSPTVAEALLDTPFVGAWTDISPNNGGIVTVSGPAADIFRVDYTAVPYFGSPSGPFCTYAIEVNTTTGAVSLLGLDGIQAHATPEAVFLGISLGNLGATDGGPTTFLAGGPNVPATLTDMIYAFFPDTAALQAALLAGGFSNIRFDPILGGPLCGQYTWTAY